MVTRLRHAAGPVVPTPPVRPGRTRRLDGTRDRLSYRSAPLGLVRREAFPSLRLTEGAPVGGDIAFVLALWFSGRSISYDRTGPAYVIGADAVDRVTFRPKPVAEEFGASGDGDGAGNPAADAPASEFSDAINALENMDLGDGSGEPAEPTDESGGSAAAGD